MRPAARPQAAVAQHQGGDDEAPHAIGLAFELGEQVQRLERRQAIDVERAEALDDRMGLGGGLKQPELLLRGRRRAAEARPAAALQFVLLERLRESPPRARTTAGGRPASRAT